MSVQISCFPLLWLSVDFFSVHSLLYIPILPITDNTRVRVLLDGSPSSPPPLSSSSSSPSSASPSSPRPFTLNEISALHHGGLLQLGFFHLLCECHCYWPFLPMPFFVVVVMLQSVLQLPVHRLDVSRLQGQVCIRFQPNT